MFAPVSAIERREEKRKWQPLQRTHSRPKLPALQQVATRATSAASLPPRDLLLRKRRAAASGAHDETAGSAATARGRGSRSRCRESSVSGGRTYVAAREEVHLAEQQIVATTAAGAVEGSRSLFLLLLLLRRVPARQQQLALRNGAKRWIGKARSGGESRREGERRRAQVRDEKERVA